MRIRIIGVFGNPIPPQEREWDFFEKSNLSQERIKYPRLRLEVPGAKLPEKIEGEHDGE
jgi:hypothetical protein